MKEIKDIRICNEVVPASFLNIPADLKSKGIYFWFADQKGIDILLASLDCKLFDKHYIMHDGQKLFLIYIGTAGTGKKKLSDLRKRLKWHLAQKHSHSSIKHGSLSNLRLALSLLLKTEVEGEFAAQAVNEFMSQNLYISWMPSENEMLISTEEKDLIKTYFPFINDRHNDKGHKRSKVDYATISFKELKKEHRNILKEKYQKSNNPQKKEITSTMKNNRTLAPKQDYSCCFLIEFKDTDNLHEIVAKYTGLGGRKFLEFSNKGNQNQKFYKKKTGIDKRRKTGGEKPDSQDIYKYFSTSGTTKNALTGKPNYKWVEVQSEMKEKGIKNAILKVCPQDNSPQKTISKKIKTKESIDSTPSNNLKALSEIDFKSMKGKPKLLILPCSGKKEVGETLDLQPLDYFGNTLNASRQNSLNYYSGLFENNPQHFGTKAMHYSNAYNANELMPAIDRYIGKPYKSQAIDNKPLLHDKINHNLLHVLIVSGLYGLLKFDDAIIDYKLQVSQNNLLNANLIHNTINNYIQDNQIENSNVFYLLSPTSGYEALISPDQEWNSLWVMQESSGTTENVLSLNDFLIKTV